MKGMNVGWRVLLLAVATSSQASLPVPAQMPHAVATTPLGIQLVTRLQEALLGRDYYHGDIDGLIGAQTQEALYLLQMEHELPLTGSVNVPTLNVLSIEPPPWWPR